MFVSAGGAGFLMSLLLSVAGGRGDVFMDSHVIGALLGERGLLSVGCCITMLHSLKCCIVSNVVRGWSQMCS